ncbi:MAG: hypothetical protein ACRDJT_12050 [Actinomycetota bacterium]
MLATGAQRNFPGFIPHGDVGEYDIAIPSGFGGFFEVVIGKLGYQV